MSVSVFLPSVEVLLIFVRLAWVDPRAPDSSIRNPAGDDGRPVFLLLYYAMVSSVLIDFESTWFSQAEKVP